MSVSSYNYVISLQKRSLHLQYLWKVEQAANQLVENLLAFRNCEEKKELCVVDLKETCVKKLTHSEVVAIKSLQMRRIVVRSFQFLQDSDIQHALANQSVECLKLLSQRLQSRACDNDYGSNLLLEGLVEDY